MPGLQTENLYVHWLVDGNPFWKKQQQKEHGNGKFKHQRHTEAVIEVTLDKQTA